MGTEEWGGVGSAITELAPDITKLSPDLFMPLTVAQWW